MDALIRLDDVTKRYDTGGRAALDGVRLQVAAGEAVVVMGPWGSGKSALLSLVADPDRPTRGMVTIARALVNRRARLLADEPTGTLDTALAGLVIAVAGAMPPATWAAGSRTAPALRAG